MSNFSHLASDSQMEFNLEFKELDGLNLPVLGIGTFGIGGKIDLDNSNDKQNVLAIKNAIKLGFTHIDTAELYALGHSEELVGEAIKDFNRKSLFITTKVSPQNLRYDDLIASAKGSLRRLKTDYIDLYLIHAPNPNIHLEETMRAMDYLVEQKLVKFIGVSNFSVNQLIQAQKHTKNKIIANQIEYNLLVRNNGQFTKDMESKIIPYCHENNIFVIAYRPFGQGKLAVSDFEILAELAKKYKKTKAQILLNWLISKKNVITIPKATDLAHIKENLGSLGWRLKKEDLIKLDKFRL